MPTDYANGYLKILNMNLGFINKFIIENPQITSPKLSQWALKNCVWANLKFDFTDDDITAGNNFQPSSVPVFPQVLPSGPSEPHPGLIPFHWAQVSLSNHDLLKYSWTQFNLLQQPAPISKSHCTCHRTPPPQVLLEHLHFHIVQLIGVS